MGMSAVGGGKGIGPAGSRTFPGRQRSGQPLQELEPAGRGDKGWAADRGPRDQLGGGEELAVDGPEPAAGLGGNDRPGGDVMGGLAEEDACLQAVTGDERDLAADAAEVAELARERAQVERPQRVRADADVVLGVETIGVERVEPGPVAPGAAAPDGPEQLAQGRDRDHAEDRLALVEQADADGPERQPMNEVAGAVDRVD